MAEWTRQTERRRARCPGGVLGHCLGVYRIEDVMDYCAIDDAITSPSGRPATVLRQPKKLNQRSCLLLRLLLLLLVPIPPILLPLSLLFRAPEIPRRVTHAGQPAIHVQLPHLFHHFSLFYTNRYNEF